MSWLGREKTLTPVYADALWDEQHLVWPVQRTLHAAFPDLEQWKRRPMIEVPRDYKKPETTGVVFHLPPWWHLTGDIRKNVVSIISSRLGITDPVASWSAGGIQPKVVIKPRQRVPEQVLWADMLDRIRAASDTAPILGLSLGGLVVDADLEDDSPHVLISAGSGGGKSALTRLIACQALHNGHQVVIADFKRTSHNWAKNLPGVTYCRRIDEIHDALVTLARVAEDRNERAEDPNADLGPRIWVVLEEMNATADKLRDYWESVREKGEAKRSPAIAGMKDLLFMGRSAKVHVVAIAQRLDAAVVGGGSSRENFALRCLTRFTPQAWKMLASDAGNPPRRSRVVGRWHIVAHGEARETQVVWVDEQQARSWALNGRPDPGQFIPLATPEDRKRLGSVAPAATPVGLREAIPHLPGPELSLAAIRKHSERDDRFPAPAGEVNGARVWELDALCRWRRERLAADRAVEAS